MLYNKIVCVIIIHIVYVTCAMYEMKLIYRYFNQTKNMVHLKTKGTICSMYALLVIMSLLVSKYRYLVVQYACFICTTCILEPTFHNYTQE